MNNTKHNPKQQLKDIASSSCSRCGGRGWTGYNETTNRYESCKCVRAKLREQKAELPQLAEQISKREMARAEAGAARLKELLGIVKMLQAEIDGLAEEARTRRVAGPEETGLIEKIRAADVALRARTDRVAEMRKQRDRLREGVIMIEDQVSRLREGAGGAAQKANELEVAANKEEQAAAVEYSDACAPWLCRVAEIQRVRGRAVNRIDKKRRETENKLERIEERMDRIQRGLDSTLEFVQNIGYQKRYEGSTNVENREQAAERE